MTHRTQRRTTSDSQVTRAKRRPKVNSVVPLRTARRIAGMTQQQLATQAGVDKSFISLIESGNRDIGAVGYETVVLIARALGVEPDELFPVPALNTVADTEARTS